MKRKTFGHERPGVTEYWKKLQIARQHDLYIYIYTALQILLSRSNQTYDGQGMWHVWQERNSYRVLVGKLEERDRLEDLYVD
jgi:hypothetical protein